MRVDVLVLTRGRERDVRRCLASLVPQLGDRDGLHVLVNGDPPAAAAALAADVPRAEVHHVPVDLGVCGGRNHLADGASAPVLLFVDDDAEAAPGLVAGVRARFADDPALGLLALRIEDPATGEPRPHEFPDRRKELADAVFAPTYFVGAGFAVRRAVFLDAGGFDARLRYSLEELDLSFRLARDDVPLAYDPSLRVVHHAVGVGAIGNLDRVVANRFRVAFRHLPLPMATSHVVVWTGVWLLRAVRAGRLPAWWDGLTTGVRELPTTLRTRDPLPRDAVARLRARHGRLWF